MSHDPPRLYAVIDPASPRYPGWCRDLGCDFVPLVSAEVLPLDYGDEWPVPSYQVDVGMGVAVGEVIVCEDPNEGRLRFPFWSGRGAERTPG